MKKILTLLGAVFLVLLIGGGAFVGYLAYVGNGLDSSSKRYVDENVPRILSGWSKDDLVRISSPQMMSILDRDTAKTDQLLKRFATLGMLESYGGAKGDANMFYTVNGGNRVTAHYVAQATFSNGEATITVDLIQLDGQWKVQGFRVDSPAFLK